jgi:hypothetical protein
MPIYGQPDAYGDLYVEYNVVLPKELSTEFRKSEPRFFPPPLLLMPFAQNLLTSSMALTTRGT